MVQCNICGAEVGSHVIGHVLYVHADVVERDILTGNMPDLHDYITESSSQIDACGDSEDE